MAPVRRLQHTPQSTPFMSVGTSGEYKLLLPMPDEDAIPREWFVSEVLHGGDRRTTHGTRDDFQSPKTFGEVETRSRKQSGKKGAWLLLLLTAPPVGRLERAGVCVNRPNHVQKVLGTVLVVADDKQKTPISRK